MFGIRIAAAVVLRAFHFAVYISLEAKKGAGIFIPALRQSRVLDKISSDIGRVGYVTPLPIIPSKYIGLKGVAGPIIVGRVDPQYL